MIFEPLTGRFPGSAGLTNPWWEAWAHGGCAPLGGPTILALRPVLGTTASSRRRPSGCGHRARSRRPAGSGQWPVKRASRRSMKLRSPSAASWLRMMPGSSDPPAPAAGRQIPNLTFITGAGSAGSWRRDLMVCWLRAASLRTRPWLGLSCDGVVPPAAAARRTPLPAEVLGLQDAHVEEVFPAVGVELGLPADALVAEAACLVAPDGPVVVGQYLQFDAVRS